MWCLFGCFVGVVGLVVFCVCVEDWVVGDCLVG